METKMYLMVFLLLVGFSLEKVKYEAKHRKLVRYKGAQKPKARYLKPKHKYRLLKEENEPEIPVVNGEDEN
jgi:hypothetical protein